ncbi:hypothetical protein GCM10011529_05510 [Polymorphobacter glacialis]|uniref:Uncharacterized protein n=1 Tax=Sandarakinorhabdus glacialis TaxID=1614636 RepID=A0A916ZLI0_9SPHN|nr:hypothetical protein [Polymorphobacter glacialis]GGE01992.1 hypothetical protein GCM10011529_05510 [Polymorphobacter glacialis]
MTAKLITGFALTFILAYAAFRYEKQALLAKLGAEVATIMLANNVPDGAAHWNDANNRPTRTAQLSGTATPAMRAKIIAELANHPGIYRATWP